MAELPRPLPPPTWRDRWASVLRQLQDAPRGLFVGALGAVVAAAGIGVGLALAGSLALPGGASGPPPELSMPRADAGAPESPAGAPTTTTAAVLHVHAAGAVARPGVVQVAAGSRVADVVAAAGGATSEADLDLVNLAAPVTDGERVYVPKRGETVASPARTQANQSAPSAPAIVNLNQATLAQLESLPGVGPATAQAILDYRTQRGRFRSVDDLLNVRGIGPAKLEQIRPHARV
ncbi:MAG TPA: helix-hairpin-helix domain-containing protein [Acidimicrobiales bacterium]|nr:helix-hairpin-helix domain-containing protein [Acidimicrobiales bacterium]